jgi:PTS system nitrogen regulatory IIA component
MNVLEVVRPECAAVGLAPASKQEALRAVARLAKASPLLSGITEDEILGALADREAIGTTGFGKGIAIPHCRLEGVEEFVVGVASVPDGVAFDALDGGSVRLIVFIVGPDRDSNEHIRILSAVSRVLSDAAAVEEMARVQAGEALAESFLRHLRGEPLPEEEPGRRLFQVFVQDEGLFKEILEIFGGTEPRFTVVLEAQNASAYLWKVPLFAGLWADNPRSFSRVIVSLVRKPMTNEMVRRIEQVAGPLDESEQVLVTVHDVFYSGGSLTT